MSFISSYLEGYRKAPADESGGEGTLDSLPRFSTSVLTAEKDQLRDTDDPMATESNYWFNQAAEKDPYLPSLSKKQRVIGFFTFLCLGIFCFAVAGLYIPFILVKSRKFVLLYSMGSLFTIGSFSLLWGPLNHIKHLFAVQRLPFTLAYFGALFGTLYSSLVLKSTLITIGFATFQIVALVWYVFSYVPGGTTGLKFFTKLFASACTKSVGAALPV